MNFLYVWFAVHVCVCVSFIWIVKTNKIIPFLLNNPYISFFLFLLFKSNSQVAVRWIDNHNFSLDKCILSTTSNWLLHSQWYLAAVSLQYKDNCSCIELALMLLACSKINIEAVILLLANEKTTIFFAIWFSKIIWLIKWICSIVIYYSSHLLAQR